jgi:hypothetical protein
MPDGESRTGDGHAKEKGRRPLERRLSLITDAALGIDLPNCAALIRATSRGGSV